LVKAGNGGDIFSQLSTKRQNEIKEKLRKNMKINNPMFDKHSRNKWEEKIQSKEYKNKMSKSVRERYKNKPEILEKKSKSMKKTLQYPKMRKNGVELVRVKKNSR
jgi:hypothetical protein